MHARIRVELALKSKCQIGCLVKAYPIHFFYFQSMPVRANVAYAGVKLEYAYKGFVMTRLIIR